MKKTGKNLYNLLDLNRSQILQYIAHHVNCSRKEIADATGLTQAAITKILHPLTDSDIVYETGFTEGKLGRRSVGLSLQYTKFRVVGAVLGWEMIQVGVFDFAGTSYGPIISIPCDSLTIDTVDSFVAQMISAIRRCITSYPDVIAIGVAVPGPYYRHEGYFVIPPYRNAVTKTALTYNIKERLYKAFDIPCFIEHDADVAALGYWWFHLNGDPSTSLIEIIAGSGIGGSILSKGQIPTGFGSCSTEIGHITIDYRGRKCMCGSTGCMNAYCCTVELEKEARARIKDHPESLLARYQMFNIETILQALEKKDAFAIELIHESGNYMGDALVSLLHIFNPDIVVISGTLARAGEHYLKAIHETLTKRAAAFTSAPEILLYEEPVDLTLLGSVALSIRRILDEPAKYLDIRDAQAEARGESI